MHLPHVNETCQSGTPCDMLYLARPCQSDADWCLQSDVMPNSRCQDKSAWSIRWKPSWSVEVSLEGWHYIPFSLSIR